MLGDVVKGRDGKPVPSQRLSTGELAFLAQDIPPLAGRRYSLHGGQPAAKGQAKAAGTTLSNAGRLAAGRSGLGRDREPAQPRPTPSCAT